MRDLVFQQHEVVELQLLDQVASNERRAEVLGADRCLRLIPVKLALNLRKGNLVALHLYALGFLQVVTRHILTSGSALSLQARSVSRNLVSSISSSYVAYQTYFSF